MQQRSVFYSLLFIWAALFAYSFYAPAMVEAAGDGFVRGANRVTLFMRWHLSALAFAAAIAVIGSKLEPSLRRWLGRVPVFLHIVAAAAILSLALRAYQEGKTEVLETSQPSIQAAPSSR